MFLAALALAAHLLANPVAVLPADVQIGVRYDSWTSDESKTNLADAVERALDDWLAKHDRPIASEDLVQSTVKDLKPHTLDKRPIPAFQDLAAKLSASTVVLVEIDRVDQKDKSPEDVLANPSAPASDTKVDCRLWVYSAAANAFTVSGADRLSGDAPGHHFGTTDRHELSGSPDDVAFAIRQVNQKRMEMVGKAVLKAVQAQLDAATMQRA